MSKMLADEIQVIKAVSMEVDSDTVLIATLQYHTEVRDDTGKLDRSKSFYRWAARAMKKNDVKDEIKARMADDKRLERGKWLDETLPFYLCIGNDSRNAAIANWLNLKLKKIVTWDAGQKILQGWKKKTAKTAEGFYPNAAYRIDGYTAANGDIVDLNDKDAILKHINQNLFAPVRKDSRAEKTAAQPKEN